MASYEAKLNRETRVFLVPPKNNYGISDIGEFWRHSKVSNVPCFYDAIDWHYKCREHSYILIFHHESNRFLRDKTEKRGYLCFKIPLPTLHSMGETCLRLSAISQNCPEVQHSLVSRVQSSRAFRPTYHLIIVGLF